MGAFCKVSGNVDAWGKADEDRVWRAAAGPAGPAAPTATLQPGAQVSRRPGDTFSGSHGQSGSSRHRGHPSYSADLGFSIARTPLHGTLSAGPQRPRS